ncbi:MAG TPA: hypothetical protein VNO84_15790 [Burkholderiaceae bacterium]|nr:hypothetical protein [Burkholderiaceae bacterium]
MRHLLAAVAAALLWAASWSVAALVSPRPAQGGYLVLARAPLSAVLGHPEVRLLHVYLGQRVVMLHVDTPRGLRSVRAMPGVWALPVPRLPGLAGCS